MADGAQPMTGLAAGELEAIVETAHEAFVSIDEGGLVRAWNAAAERTFGWPRDEALGRPLRDLVIPERYRERHDAGLRRFLETGEGPLLNTRIEISACHRHEHEFPVEMTISALRTDDGWRFNAFVRDITERYAAGETQRRLATLVEHSADAIVSRDRDGRITSWNPGAERLYGYRADEIVGDSLDRLVPADRAGEAQQLLERALAGESVGGFETQRVRKDGRLVDVSITISPIQDAAGQISEVSLIARDISGRKEAERALTRANEELRQLSELKSHFVAVASHELRTPLTSIGGFAATLRARWETLDDETRRTFVATIDEQSQRLTRLVEDILSVSKIESGGPRRPGQAVDVGAVVRQVLREQALEHDIRVSVGGQPRALADPDYVHQIVLNYVANARAHGAAPITITVAQNGDVELRVCDGGRGVPPEFVPHLFEPFTQADGATSGTGLGLAIVRGLASASGGEAWYEPNVPSGACFCVRLPRA